MWTLQYTLSQLCVFVAACLYSSTFFIKNRNAILVLTCIISLIYSIQYFLLDSYTGVAINIVAILRCVWFYINNQRGKTKDYISLIICCVIFIISGILTYKHPMDIIAIVNVLIFSYTVWQSSVVRYRYIAPFCSLGWIAYNIYTKSILSVIFESIIFLIGIVGIIKTYRQEKSKKNTLEI